MELNQSLAYAQLCDMETYHEQSQGKSQDLSAGLLSRASGMQLLGSQPVASRKPYCFEDGGLALASQTPLMAMPIPSNCQAFNCSLNNSQAINAVTAGVR